MKLIVETDIGHDPDDFFALCYLYAAGADIRAILVSVGYDYQTAIARFFCKEVGLNIPIGIVRNTPFNSDGKNFHHALLESFGYPTEDKPDGLGKDILRDILNEHPDSQMFICGAPKNTGACLMENPDVSISKITVQGGFLPYTLHSPKIRLDKFEGKDRVPTYNLNGAKKEALFIIDHERIGERRFVSKNLCHTIVYDRERHEWMKRFPAKSKAKELFIKGMDIYLKKHKEKKFHDPTAAVCHMHPEIALWYQGKLYCEGGHWGTRPNPNADHIIADIDREKLWNHIAEGT